MTDRLAEWLNWLQNSTLAAEIRNSLWLYPAIEIVHILGIVLVAGGAILFDIRLLRLSSGIPVSHMAAHLLPWSRRGLLLAVPSGILLFITNAETLGYDPTFQIKLILLGLAGLNAWIFHVWIFKGDGHTKDSQAGLVSARATAISSILLWSAIISCGRLLAY